jgi:iron complex outermembrane receptor protein
MAAFNHRRIVMRKPNGAMLLRFHKLSLVSAGLLAAGLSQQALAQSTGSEIVEDDMNEVVVSATRVRNIGIVGEQNAPKSRISLTGEYLETQLSGQSVFQSLNQIPGVNFTNSDPFGTSGGNLRIRGFDGSRVSVTFDGIPLNDSGNYALFTNQMLDSELIDRVDVNLGTTDVDSPTASATGGTVAYRTRRPSEEFGGQATLSAGDHNYRRAFLRLDSGAFGPWDTKAFFSASYQNYDKFKGPGELEKKQVNGMLRQDFENGNFITLAAHFNRNRNAFYRTTSAANYAAYGRDYDNLAVCTRDAPTAGVADNDNATPVASTPALSSGDNPLNSSSCSNYYGVRINPSDTGNIRMQSLWHLGESLRLTFDPSWQYTMANGGGSTALAETPSATSADIRVRGNSALPGVDLNGDGDLLDTVRFYSPNTTNTKRWGATTSLIWDLNDAHRLRFAYTWDRARHRQTGMFGPLSPEGTPENVFAGRQGDRVLAADGDIIRGRDRFSIAELKQYALEWRGQFLEGEKLTATIGVRAPFFERQLNQFCYTPNGGTGNSGTIGAGGGTLCTSRAPNATLPNGNVTFVTPMTGTAVQFIAPYSETVKFDDILPNAGLTLSPWDQHTFYLSYAEGLSAPRTDNLYAVIRLPDGSIGRPTPQSEMTKSYDLGWRLNHPTTLASVAVYHIDYTDRIVSTFDPDLGFSVDRNVGDVKIQGIDAQVGRRFGEKFTATLSAAFNDSELQENVPTSATTFLATAGKQLVETPEWTYSTRLDYAATDDLRFALQGKYVGERFATDLNDEKVDAYTVVDLDASYTFKFPGIESAQIQLNITNLLDEDYFGNISSGTGGTSVGFYSIGAPRTATATLKFNF